MRNYKNVRETPKSGMDFQDRRKAAELPYVGFYGAVVEMSAAEVTMTETTLGSHRLGQWRVHTRCVMSFNKREDRVLFMCCPTAEVTESPLPSVSDSGFVNCRP